MEAYRVWATLELKGNAQKQMERFYAITRKTSTEMAKLSKLLGPVNSHFEKLTSILRVLNPEFSKFSVTLVRLNTNAIGTDRSITSLNANLSNSASRMASVTARAHRLASSLNAVAINSGLASRGVGVIHGGRGGRRGGAGSSGTGGFAHGAAVGVGLRHVAGLGGIAAGYATAHTVGSAFHAGNDYQKEMGLLLAQNIPGLNKETIEKFVNNSQIKGASRLDMLSALADAAVITKGGNEALGVAPTLAKMKLVGEGYGKNGFSMTTKQLQAAVKTAEIVSGSRESDILNKHLGMMMQAWVSTSGRVDPSQYQSIVRSSRGYAKGLNPDFFYYMLEPMIQEFGTRTGPMIAQFFQHMRVGRLTTQGAQILGQLGLVDPKAVQLNKMGMIKGISPGGIRGMDIAGKDIFGWIDKFLVPALDKAGYKSDESRMGVLGKIFTNSDLTLILTYLQQKAKFEASGAANAKTSTMDTLLDALSDKHAGAMQVFSSSFKDFALSLDKLTGPMVDATLKGLARLFNAIGFIAGSLGNFNEKLAAGTPGASSLSTLVSKSGNYSLFNNANLSSPSSSSGGSQSIGHVYLDAERVGKVILSKAGSDMQTYVQHGTSGINTLSAPIYPGINNLGWQG